MKTARDYAGKEITVPVKATDRQGNAKITWVRHKIDKLSAQRIARNVNIINELVSKNKS